MPLGWRTFFREPLLGAGLSGLLVVVSAAHPVRAETGPTPGEGTAWYERLAVNAFVSASWGHGFNDPASGSNQLRCFDEEDGSVVLDVASLVVRKEAVERGEAGFRLDALAGSTFPAVTAADGLFRDASGEAGSFDLLQAYVAWVAPVGRGLTLDVGKFLTRAGYEVVDGFEDWNANASRSLQFTLSEPTTHTGLRAGYAFSEALRAELLLVNGWDDARDRNGRKTVGVGIDLEPGPGWALSATLLHGPEREGNDTDDRTLFVLSAGRESGGAVDAALCLEVGREEGLGKGGAAVSWWSLAGYVTWKAAPALTLALRAEVFDDPDGARTDVPQRLWGLTLTPALRLARGLVARADFRVDVSDEAVFEDADGAFTLKRQPTLLLNLLYAF